MKKKIVWLVVSCLMVAALVLASCGPAEEEEVVAVEEEVVEEEEEVIVEEEEEVVVTEEEAEMVKITAVKRDGTVVGKWVEKPRYGGVFVQSTTGSPSRFDEALGMLGGSTLTFTNEELFGADWTKGPAGTGESTWMYTPFPMEGYMVGRLAESWEMPDADTFVWHIRQGVHFHDKPPVNGRELTADDILFSLLRMWKQDTPRSFNALNYPWDSYIESITAPDKWTVVLKCQPGVASRVMEALCVTVVDYPREVVEQYGDIKDWRNSCGTGAFMLVDYVPDNSWTMERNPNYWMKDPLHPENTLPYVDGLKTLIIPDRSTRMAALRTAKLDWITGVTWEDAERFMETNPELKYQRYLAGATGINMRVDKPELPFYDKRVRHALALAVNNQEIADTYYGGQAEVLFWPVAPILYLKDCFTPLEELPESSRQLYEYHPDKARQLLDEAGYPDGFKTEIVCLSTEVDLLSIVKEYWAKIGVELTLDVRESAVKTVVGFKKAHKEMFSWSAQGTIPYTMVEIRKGFFYNFSMIDDPVVEEAWDAVAASYFNHAERSRLMKELAPHLIDQTYLVVLPAYYNYTFWQPWVKGYQGEKTLSTADTDFPRWIWLDQDLKEEMTGKR